MNRASMVSLVLVWTFFAGCASEQTVQEKPAEQKKESIQYVETDSGTWKVHDDDRPVPPVVTPSDEPGGAPSLMPLFCLTGQICPSGAQAMVKARPSGSSKTATWSP